MNTIKTAAVVVVLLGVLYGVYTALNRPEPVDLADDPDWQQHGVEELKIDTGQLVDPTQLTPFDPTAAFNDPSPAFPPPTASGSSLDDPSAPPAYSVTTTPAPEFTQPAPYPTTHVPESPAEPSSRAAVASYTDAASPPSAYAPQSGLMDATEPGVAPENYAAESYGANTASLKQHDLGRALEEARDLINGGQFADALARLTIYYHSPDLSADEHDTLLEWLNLLARKVVYSKENHLDEPYISQPGDTLETIARLYDVPPLLLYKINSDVIPDPTVLAPQTELKVVRGPFYARVDITRRKLTLFVQQHFAGEFAVELGSTPAPLPGTYRVTEKSQWRKYVSPDGQVFDENDQRNPYGQWYLQIGGDMAIHGVSSAASGMGCIGLDPVDAEDVFGILSQNSSVEILR